MSYLDFQEILDLAKIKEWDLITHQAHISMVSFKKNGCRINIYYSKGTISTALEHPKKGKTQLFRKYVDIELLEKIFDNPRVHTDRGYRFK